MTETETAFIPDPADLLLHLLIAFLTPIFMTVAGGDIAFARMAALDAINGHRIRDNADLMAVAQIIGFSMTALGSLGLSFASGTSLPMTLRLRGNAVSLNRVVEQNRRAIRENQPGLRKPPATTAQPAVTKPSAVTMPIIKTPMTQAAVSDAPVSEARVDAASATAAPMLAARVAPIQVIADPVSALATTPTTEAQVPEPPVMVAPETVSPAMVTTTPGQCAIPEVIQLGHSPAVTNSQAIRAVVHPPLIPTATRDQKNLAMWATAMAQVGAKSSVELATLPPGQQNAAGIRASAMNSVAHEIMLGLPIRPTTTR